MSIEVDIATSFLAPFRQQVGVQGFVYGLLGLKTIRRIIDWGRSLLGGKTERSVDIVEE